MSEIIVTAEQKFVRISPRKMLLVVKAIKKLRPSEALLNLKFLNKRAAFYLIKVIKQAIANAVNNYKLNEDELRFKHIQILKGPILKRWHPVSRGRAHAVLKRTSHIRVVLTSVKKENSKKKDKIIQGGEVKSKKVKK